MAQETQDALLAGLMRSPLGHEHLSAAERALLDYADSLTLTPQDNQEAFVAALRQHGFDDLAIHDACGVIAYFAFVNRIADGLGVEIEQPSAG